ncbi:hypothetical protein, partial [Roseivivax isoporae]|uniref:hypothetical protein n=1 Tax=Roseivivax isoporae TaxID=591206 RepID=UPI0005C242BF
KRSLESYVYGSNTPGAPALLTLFGFLGPGFASEVLGVCGLVATDESEEAAQYAQVMTAICAMASDLAAALEDGHVDHREAAQLREPARELIERLEPLARSEPSRRRGAS